MDLLTSVMRIPGIPTGTGSNFVPGDVFSTARTKPIAPSVFAVCATLVIDAVPMTKLKEYPHKSMFPFTIFLFKTSGFWQSDVLDFPEESNNTSLAATRVYF